MNIYIYGSKSFKKDVHDELDHSNIKFKLDDNSAISDITGLDDLKRLIENNEDDIFLIDDAKIIKKDALNGKFKSKLKFLIPKDGIEEEYLFEHGVGDISFDSIEELSTHITNKIKSQNSDENDAFDNRDEIHESISEIVNDAYEEDDSIKLNDELNQLLVSNDMETASFEEPKMEEEIAVEQYNAFDFENELNTIEKGSNSVDKDDLDELLHLDITNDDFEENQENDTMMEELANLSIGNEDFEKEFDSDKKKSPLIDEGSDVENSIDNENFGNEIQNDLNEKISIGNTQGEYEMAGDFSSLDEINESDIIAALNGEEVSISETQVLTSTNKNNDAVSINLSNTDDISELLGKLLKNKTLEITVKIKE